jgi:hypothetical protein
MSISRLIRLAVVAWIVSMIIGAVAALKARQAIGPDTEETADEFSASAIFGPLAYHSAAKALRDGRLECWYGGGVLDLRDATLAPDGATLHVRAVFGGGQILVPAGWRVATSVRGFGGVQDTRPAQDRSDDAPDLSVEGMVFAGGFAIMSELDDEQAEWLAGMEARAGHAPAATNGTSDAALNEPEMTPAG